jgi:hypothetical protein
MISCIQGAVTGGAVLYFYQNQLQEKKAQDVWLNVASQVNHLFLITGILLSQANVNGNIHSNCAKYFFLATPFILGFNFYNKEREVTSLESSIKTILNSFYFIAAICTSIVLVILGNRDFGITFLSMICAFLLARAGIISFSVNKMDIAKTSAALLALIGYSARVFDTSSMLNKIGMGVILAEIFITKFREQTYPNSAEKSQTIDSDKKKDKKPEEHPETLKAHRKHEKKIQRNKINQYSSNNWSGINPINDDRRYGGAGRVWTCDYCNGFNLSTERSTCTCSRCSRVSWKMLQNLSPELPFSH